MTATTKDKPTNAIKVYWLGFDGERHIHTRFDTLFQEAESYLSEMNPGGESLEITVDSMTQKQIDALPDL